MTRDADRLPSHVRALLRSTHTGLEDEGQLLPGKTWTIHGVRLLGIDSSSKKARLT